MRGSIEGRDQTVEKGVRLRRVIGKCEEGSRVCF
jgi:hypothetical protein